MSMFDLTDRVAIVTGGNGGIGLGIARGLAEAGAWVVLTGRNVEKGEAAVKEVPGSSFMVADVTVKADCVGMVEETMARYGRLDILVNNAGTSLRRLPQDLTEEEWHMIIDTNLTSAFLCSQAAYPYFVQCGGGKIINIGSIMSLTATGHAAAYAASKGGMLQFTKSIAVAWAAENIQCNSILPGYITTELTDGSLAVMPWLNQYVLQRTPAGRWGDPSDVAGVAVFLASSASDFVTGAAIACDGGYLAKA